MLTCHFWLKVKSKTECPFLMYRLVVKIKHLPPLFTVNLPLVEFIHILTAFCHLLISLVLFTHSWRCLWICSSWTKLHNELIRLKEIFLKNGCPDNFMNKCFKNFMDNIHAVETTPTVAKKPLVLVLPYLGSISLQTRTRLKKSLKNILNCCKLQIVFKNKTWLGNNFHFKDQISKDLTSGFVYKF